MTRRCIVALLLMLAGVAGTVHTGNEDRANAANGCGSREIWVNDWQYGSAGGGFYWDPLSSMVWTPARGWHYFAPAPPRAQPEPLWVNQLDYGSRAGGYYWDPVSGQIWTGERGWHVHGAYGCQGESWLVDQEQPLLDAAAGPVVIGGASDGKLAQTLTAGVSGRLVVVRLPIRCEVDAVLTLEIQAADSGPPDGTVLASQSFAGVGLPNISPSPPEYHGFGFVTPVGITKNARYAIVATVTGGDCLWYQGPVGDPYPRGNMYFDARPNPPGWVGDVSGRLDLPFQTIVEPN